MTMTFDQAITALTNPNYQTLESLKQLVAQVSAQVPGQISNATTLLYSGMVGDIPAWQIAEQIGALSNNQVITINQTPVAKFLADSRFLSALEDAAGTDNATVIKSLLDGTINPDGTRTQGMWDIASKNLAAAATGDVHTITPYNAPST